VKWINLFPFSFFLLLSNDKAMQVNSHETHTPELDNSESTPHWWGLNNFHTALPLNNFPTRSPPITPSPSELSALHLLLVTVLLWYDHVVIYTEVLFETISGEQHALPCYITVFDELLNFSWEYFVQNFWTNIQNWY
jgi:hypothetical protein